MKEKLIFATGNAHKLKEVNDILGTTNYVAVSMKSMGVDEDIVEDGDTMHANAQIKSDFLYERLSTSCFSEDSGLEIEALDMQPGIYTARFAGEQRDDDQNMDKVLELLKNETNRNAQFRAVISLNLDGEQYFFEGIIKGRIGHEKTGENGFGYDPIFIPEGQDKSFACLGDQIKNTMSHRKRAVSAMADFLNNYKSETA